LLRYPLFQLFHEGSEVCRFVSWHKVLQMFILRVFFRGTASADRYGESNPGDQ
jgi:hypothetical protein